MSLRDYLYPCILALAACGKVTATPPDGGPGDDAPADDAPQAGPATLTVLTYEGDGAPELTVTVVFTDLEGNVLYDGPVDAEGKVTAEFPPEGGSMTSINVVLDDDANALVAITTITGVKPGDDLTIGLKRRATIRNEGGQTMMIGNFTPVSGADHEFFTTCGSSFSGSVSPVTLSLRDSCHGATFDLVGVASGGNLNVPRFVHVPGVAHNPGATFNIPGGFQQMSNFTVDVTGTPDRVTAMTVTRSSLLESTPVAPTSQTVPGDPPAGTVTATLPFPPNVGTRSEVIVAMNASGARQELQVHTGPVGASTEVDAAAHELPWLTELEATPTGGQWLVLDDGAGTADGMVFQWSGAWDEGKKTMRVAWRIAQPVGTLTPNERTVITLPRLPEAHARFDPQAQTVPVAAGTGFVFMVDIDRVDGYDDFKTRPDTLIDPRPSDIADLAGMPFVRQFLSEPLRAVTN